MSATPLHALVRWHVHRDVDALLASALGRTLSAATAAIAARGSFKIVLAGGSTPRGLYEHLRGQACDWPAWHVWFGDERCAPPDDDERNSRMAAEAWLDHVAIPPSQRHDIASELGAEAAADRYVRTLADVGRFDLVLLGIGEDGHTASLFPGHDAGTAADSPSVLPVHDAPKPPPDRVSLSARRLAESDAVVFLIAGAGKRDAVRRWRAGEAIPASRVAPSAGVDVLLDEAAFGAP